jgi:hypothetical protein
MAIFLLSELMRSAAGLILVALLAEPAFGGAPMPENMVSMICPGGHVVLCRQLLHPLIDIAWHNEADPGGSARRLVTSESSQRWRAG